MRLSTRAVLAAFVLAICCCPSGQSQPRSPDFDLHAAADARHKLVSDAAGCTVTTLSCGVPASGELAPGDCTFDDGTKYDVWSFSGVAGQTVRLSVAPLDSTYTTPDLILVPPQGDASTPPETWGPGSPAILYKLSSSGEWRVGVSTRDLLAKGRYSLLIACGGPSPGPQSCVAEPLECGQSSSWYLTGDSCLFADQQHVYAWYELPLKAGDVLSARVVSDDYDPAVGIYQPGNSEAVSVGFGRRFTTPATALFVAPFAATFRVLPYSISATQAGFFSLSVSCQSNCTPPQISQQPAAQTISSGQTATLTATAVGVGPFTYQWYSGLPPDTSKFVGSGQTITTPPLTSTTSFWVRASNDCGSADSQTAIVTVTACSPPSIVTSPQGGLAKYGAVWTFSVTALGSAPLSYAWYGGDAPDTSKPLGFTASAFTTAPLATNVTTWVRVTNPCGTADSATARLIVDVPRRRTSKP